MDIQQAIYAFSVEGKPVACQCFGAGHINQTYLVTTDKNCRYILQYINNFVFKDPVALMENAAGVTDFIRARGGKALHFLRTADGKAVHVDEEGRYWRVYEFVEGLCLQAAETADDFYQSGLAFGQFQNELLEYPAETLAETIPNFHNTPARFAQLKEAIAKNASGRLDSCKAEVEGYLALEAEGCKLASLGLPLRVTHNDTKLNNVLLNETTHAPLCVLDLDTVMPGLAAYDFGDSIRFGAATAAEDEKDVSKMHLDMGLFEAFAKGFLQGAAALTKAEVESLPLGAFTMTLECGSRFLADYLNGDTYFRTAYPEHNLVRCRTQLALARDMLAHMADMQAVIAKLTMDN